MRKHHWASPLLANAISLDTLFQVFTGCYRSFTLLLRVYHSLQSFDQIKKGKNLMAAKAPFDHRSRSLFGAPTSAIPQLIAPAVSITVSTSASSCRLSSRIIAPDARRHRRGDGRAQAIGAGTERGSSQGCDRHRS